ncbi:hypothetical protein [Aureispira sp. CCB-E]|uniref:hypothetical protein n=1 Tax=Aureispira sp. CCB-E TaxID=3051121 RepID=UPI002868B84E|nr:hypothetical protein [Aureispira sp. CCB-E]WMX13168.1 hypothetical protein QP953_20200 [Aureispira sp. CCB-E]
MNKEKKEQWIQAISWFEEICEEFDYELKPLIDYMYQIKENQFWDKYYPSFSHDSLGICKAKDFNDRLYTPMIYITYDSESDFFTIHYQEGQGNELSKETVEKEINDEITKRIQNWLEK